MPEPNAHRNRNHRTWGYLFVLLLTLAAILAWSLWIESGTSFRSGNDVARSAATAEETWKPIEGNDPAAKSPPPERSMNAATDIGGATPGEQPSARPQPALSLSGFVLTRSGVPVPGISVEARRPGALDRVISQTVSGQGGYYRFNVLEDSEYELRTVATVRFPSVKRRVRAGTDQADLVLADAGDTQFIYGQVTDAAAMPLPRVRISIAGNPANVTQSGDDGFYELEVIPPTGGSLAIQFRHPSYEVVSQSVNLASRSDSEPLRLDIEMQSAGAMVRVEGILSGPDGQAVSNERVTLFSPGLQRNYETRSGTDGRFSIAEVITGSDYRLQVRPQKKFRDYNETGLVVPADGLELVLVLEYQQSGRISGQILDPDGRPVPDFALWLESESSQGQPLTVRSNRSGAFKLDKVPSGALRFATRSDPEFRINGAMLEAEAEIELLLVIDWGEYTLQGRIIDKTGFPVAGAPIILTWSDQRDGLRSHSVRKARADQDGQFLFTQLGSGWHHLNVSAPGHPEKRLDVPIGGANEWMEVRLE